MSTLQYQLRSMRACAAAVNWVGTRDLRKAWDECQRGDWMLWLLGRMSIDRKLLVQACCDCAETTWEHTENAEVLQAFMLAIHITREWCEGRTDIEDVHEARAIVYAALAASAASAASAAAARAARAAAAAAVAAVADAAVATYAAAAAAAAAAAYDAAACARDKSLADFAEEVVQLLIKMNVPGVQWLTLAPIDVVA